MSLAAVTRPALPVAQEAMVQRTCAICHALPPPEILPKSAWKRVVRDMTGLIVEGTGMPASSAASAPDFDVEQIADYYERRAPRELPSPAPWPAPGAASARFVRHRLDLAGAKGPAAVANVRLLELAAGAPPTVVAVDMLAGLVLAGEGKRGASGLREIGHLASPCHVSAVDLDRDGRRDLLVADLGNPVPGDTKQGSVTWMRSRPDGTYQSIPLATGLPRVADAEAGDFDGDGDLDLVVAAFGWRKVGAILLLENRTTDWTQPVVRRRGSWTCAPVRFTFPSPISMETDGSTSSPSSPSSTRRCPPSSATARETSARRRSTARRIRPGARPGIQLVDLDGDKDLDVLVTNGDMLDDFQMKPYHGDPLAGEPRALPLRAPRRRAAVRALRAQAADLDGDGDMDIVAGTLVQLARTAPAAPPSRDLPSLVWLEQTAPGRFERHTLESGGRHLSLDLGDTDLDGDVDIVVANSLSGTPGFVEVWENAFKNSP